MAQIIRLWAYPEHHCCGSNCVRGGSVAVRILVAAALWSGPVSAGENDQQPADPQANTERKGEWLLAPIPISSPAIGSGLEWAVARLFPFNKKDEVSPASAVGVAGIFTNNGSDSVNHLRLRSEAIDPE